MERRRAPYSGYRKLGIGDTIVPPLMNWLTAVHIRRCQTLAVYTVRLEPISQSVYYYHCTVGLLAYSIIIFSALVGLSALIEEVGVDRFIGIDIDIDEVATCSISLFIGIDMDEGMGVVAGCCISCNYC